MPDFISELRKELLDAGCPASRIKALVREVEDHRDDLFAEASVAGLSATESDAQATAKLGNAKALAERLAASLRHSTWCGRHALAVFGLMPALMAPVLWFVLLILELYVWLELGYRGNKEALHKMALDPARLHDLVFGLQCADLMAAALVTISLCWLARRAAVCVRWMVIASVICSAYAMFSYAKISPNALSFGLAPHPQWLRAAVPLMVAGAVWVWEQRKVSVLRAEAVE